MKSRMALPGLLVVFCFLVAVLVVAPAGANGGLTFKVSVTSQGDPADNNSFESDISADGRYVAFRSGAGNFQDPIYYGYGSRIYVRDNTTGQIEPATVRYDGSIPDFGAQYPSLSADGRLLAFQSRDEAITPESTYYTERIYVRDLDADVNYMVSVASDGALADGDCVKPDMSASGRFVVFTCIATNLAPNDNNWLSDVFIHDRETGETERVSVAPDGSDANGESYDASVSDDGNFVAFWSIASNLVDGDTNETWDAFVYDRQAGQTTRVSVGAGGAQASGTGGSISGDGRYVAFASSSGVLTGLADGERTEVFVYDRQTGATERVSLDSAGAPPPAGTESSRPRISPDGRYVTFASNAPLTPEAPDFPFHHAYLRDRVAGTTEMVSLGPNGAATVDTYPPEPSPLSADGRFVAFTSPNEAVVGDTPGDDVFVRDRAPMATAFTVSGVVYSPDGQPVAGVTVSNGQGDEATTGADGIFTFAGLPSGTYLLTPRKVGLAFTSVSDYATVPPDSDETVFQSREAYDITGRIVNADGYGLSWTQVDLSDGQQTVTDNDGYYRFEDVDPGAHTITPVHEDYDFTPPARDVTLGPDATDQDFTASFKLSSISGTILDQDGAPLPGVTLSITGYGYDVSVLTNADGFYQFTDLPLDNASVRPELAGYRFEPEYEIVYLPADLTDVNFTGISLAVEIVYVSTAVSGRIGPLWYDGTDILAYDIDSSAWSLYFDGSDVGLARNVNNFAFQEDGNILLTLALPQWVAGVGLVQPHDILLFRPTALGPQTAGALEMYMDGSDVGLTTPAEHLDALGVERVSLLTSILGNGQLAGFSQQLAARNDDILITYLWTTGWQTEGFSQRYRDLAGFPNMAAENITGLAGDPLTGSIYVSFDSGFNVGGVVGKAGTIVELIYDAGTYAPHWFWDARQAGLVGFMDGFEIGR